MRRHAISALLVLLISTVLFGAIFHLAIWVIALPFQNGSEDIVQAVYDDRAQHQGKGYFTGRLPMHKRWADGHSNEKVPDQQAMSATIFSASECDPHISVSEALAQAPRIAAARQVSLTVLHEAIALHELPSYLGLFPKVVCVAEMNAWLDRRYPTKALEASCMT